MSPYKVIVVDDDPFVRNFLMEYLLGSGDFDVHSYGEAEAVLQAFDACPIEASADLIIVDLQLEHDKMQGTELIGELTDRDAPCEILVLTGTGNADDVSEAIKAGAARVLLKPFDDIFALRQVFETLAETGRKRRLYRLAGMKGVQEVDGTRLHRPVFLSYSSKDRKIANVLRRNLEARGISVWYAPTVIEIGESWRNRIREGIDSASILVALVTDNYLASGTCMSEFTRFHERMDHGLRPHPLILPVVAGLSEEGRRNNAGRLILERYQCADVSRRFTDGLTVLLGRIQIFLGLTSHEPEIKNAASF